MGGKTDMGIQSLRRVSSCRYCPPPEPVHCNILRSSIILTSSSLTSTAGRHANAATFDAQIACFDTKFAYWFIRPSQADPAITLPIGLPNHPSYPSPHACITSALLTVLADALPGETTYLMEQVELAGLSRVYAGIHIQLRRRGGPGDRPARSAARAGRVRSSDGCDSRTPAGGRRRGRSPAASLSDRQGGDARPRRGGRSQLVPFRQADRETTGIEATARGSHLPSRLAGTIHQGENRLEPIEIRIVRQGIPRSELVALAQQQFGDMVKAVVDTERRMMAIAGELQSDEESLLLDDGSKQTNLWGINLYPGEAGPDWIEYDSMINVRPSQGNRSRGVDDPQVRRLIREIVESLVGES